MDARGELKDIKWNVTQENYHFEKEKIDNQSFIARRGQSSNHVLKNPHRHPVRNHILGALCWLFFTVFFNFSQRLKGICIKYFLPKLFLIKL